MDLPYGFAARALIQEARTTQTALDEVKLWLATTDLPRSPDELMVLFLIACRNDVAAARGAVTAYFRIKKSAPELFRDRDIDRADLAKAMNVITCCALPRRMDGRTVIHLFNLVDTNYRNFDLVSNMKLTFMLNDVSQRSDPPDKLIILIDMKGSTLKHLTCIRMSAVKKFLHFVQEGMPLRLDSIHVLNADFIFEKVFAIVKLFMKADIISLIKPHRPQMTMAEFQQKWIPASHLPKDYQGELSSCEELNQRTIQQCREMKSFFQAEERFIDSYNDK